MHKKVVILGMGGTIASIKTSQGFKPVLTSEKLLKEVPEITRFCDIECYDLMNIDSSNLQPEDWEHIVKSILEHINRSDVDGVVVTHGTDTMSFTASAMAILTRNLGKPVVFTGSQIPLSEFGSDAKRNIIDAIRIAASTNIAESVICFNSHVYRGCRTLKLREYDLDAFETVDPIPIAEIARTINIIDNSVKTRSPETATYDGPLNPNVALIKAFPGMNPEILTNLVNLGYEGVVIEGFGAGNLPILKRSLVPPIAKLINLGIPVVLTTQCVFGRTESLLYETGKNFHDLGIISGHDMISEVALIKLMWALGKSKELERISELMHKNLAGEINPQFEKF